MTKEEHGVIIAMFAKQYQSMKVLSDIMRSRGIIEQGDFSAFHFAVQKDDPLNVAIYQQTKEQYLKYAKGIGVDTGLEAPEPTPES